MHVNDTSVRGDRKEPETTTDWVFSERSWEPSNELDGRSPKMVLCVLAKYVGYICYLV